MSENKKRRTEWERFKYTRPRCDICNRVAVYRHPLGGLRCATCPRPETRAIVLRAALAALEEG